MLLLLQLIQGVCEAKTSKLCYSLSLPSPFVVKLKVISLFPIFLIWISNTICKNYYYFITEDLPALKVQMATDLQN